MRPTETTLPVPEIQTVPSNASIERHLATIHDLDQPSRHVRKAVMQLARPLARTILCTSEMRGQRRIQIVPIMRAGLALEPAFWYETDEMAHAPQLSVWHIGATRSEVKSDGTHDYGTYGSKIPSEPTAKERTAPIVILDPMLATGGTAIAVIRELRQLSYKNFFFGCLFAAPEGVIEIAEFIDPNRIFAVERCYGLDDKNYIVNPDGTPVAGDLGDRLNNTHH